MPQLHVRHFEALNQSTFFATQTRDGLVEIVDFITDVIGPGAHSGEDLLNRRVFVQTLNQLDPDPRFRSNEADPHVLGHHLDRSIEDLEAEDPRVEIQGLFDAPHRHRHVVKARLQISKDRRNMRIHHVAKVNTNVNSLYPACEPTGGGVAMFLFTTSRAWQERLKLS